MNDIDEILMAFYVNHGDVVVDPEFVLKQKQALLSTIKAGLPEKYTQTEMMAGIDDSADYRDGYNQALKAVEDYLDSLFSKGEDV